MRARISVSISFSASHTVSGHSTCGRGDGHDWVVEASVTGEVSPKTGMVVDHGELENALKVVCSEIDHKNLNDMLPGVVATPEGLAAYIHERLIMSFPAVTSVTVKAGSYVASIDWQQR